MLSGLSNAYYVGLDGFTGPGSHPEQQGGPESRSNGYNIIINICKISNIIFL